MKIPSYWLNFSYWKLIPYWLNCSYWKFPTENFSWWKFHHTDWTFRTENSLLTELFVLKILYWELFMMKIPSWLNFSYWKFPPEWHFLTGSNRRLPWRGRRVGRKPVHGPRPLGVRVGPFVRGVPCFGGPPPFSHQLRLPPSRGTYTIFSRYRYFSTKYSDSIDISVQNIQSV